MLTLTKKYNTAAKRIIIIVKLLQTAEIDTYDQIW